MSNPSTQAEKYFNEGFCYLNSFTIKDKNINYSRLLCEDSEYDLDNGFIGAIKLYSYDYEKAIEKFNEAISQSPVYALAYKYRAKAYESLEKYKEATADYNTWIKLDPDNAIAYLNRANCIADYDEEKALLEYNKVLELKPEYISAYNNRGRTYFSLNRKALGILDFEKSIALCTQKIQNNSKDAINYYYRGWALEKLDKKTEAMQDFDQSIALNPKHFASYFSRGFLKYNQEDYEGAIFDFRETLNLDPNNYYCCMMLANCYLEMDKLKEAMVFCIQSLTIKETDSAMYIKSILLSGMENYRAAQQSYEKTYEINPGIRGLKRHIKFLQHYNRLGRLPGISKWQLQKLKLHITKYKIDSVAGKFFKRYKTKTSSLLRKRK